MTRLAVVVGGQFGSEAKGHVVKRLIDRIQQQEPHSRILNIRVAGPNAGHTVYDSAGDKFAFRQLPVGAVLNVDVGIAAGSEIAPAVLFQELKQAHAAGHHSRLFIDPEATLLTGEHQERESELVGRIGSTGKGIGAARVDRLMRRAQRIADDEDLIYQLRRHATVIDSPVGNGRIHTYNWIIVEGTQGFGLGLHAGYYPYATSSDCRALDFLAMAGINPWDVRIRQMMVLIAARVYPIRVAGNSGPLLHETTWENLGLPEERTTVTQKVRRVGLWDADLIHRAVEANGGYSVARVALTMIDQALPFMKDRTDLDGLTSDELNLFWSWVNTANEDSQTMVPLVTTGPDTGIWLNPHL